MKLDLGDAISMEDDEGKVRNVLWNYFLDADAIYSLLFSEELYMELWAACIRVPPNVLDEMGPL